jgi:hypothetical protein
MKDWRTYFKTRLTHKGQFTFDIETSHGETGKLVFKSSNPDNLTIIQIGILDNGDLITFEIHNPRTPGFSQQQKREYFYKYSFHPTERYGGPGLEFIQLNIDHFDKLLNEGLRGKEIQYFKNGQLMKSEVFQFYAENGDNDLGTTVEFGKKGLWNKILDAFKSRDELYDYKKEIELKEIFHGIS